MQLRRSTRLRSARLTRGLAALAVACTLHPLGVASAARAGVLERVRAEGKIRLGHRVDAQPFSYEDGSGNAAGYTVTLCQRIADAVKADLGVAQLAVEHVKVGPEDRFAAVEQAKVDLLCGADTATLARRKQVSFSIPVFPSGVAALLREDRSQRLRAVLEGRAASPTQGEEKRVFAAQAASTADAWLRERRSTLDVRAELITVPGYKEGVEAVLARRADALFADRGILLGAAASSPSAGDLIVLPRLYTYEPIALALARGDEDFRTLVDRTLSRLYRSGEINELYEEFFGAPDADTSAFFRFVALPE